MTNGLVVAWTSRPCRNLRHGQDARATSMSFELSHNAYGKSAVRLTKVVRNGARHELFEIDAAIQLEGAFEPAYHDGDNRNVVATDSIKNTVYVLAKENSFDCIERFASILAKHFIITYPQVTKSTIE